MSRISINELPERSIKEKNYWADYLELLCLSRRPDPVTVDDIKNMLQDKSVLDETVTSDDMLDSEDILEELELEEAFETVKADLSDKKDRDLRDVFLHITHRNDLMGVFYPFMYVDGEMRIKDGFIIEDSVYCCLLLCSLTKYCIEGNVFWSEFERIGIQMVKKMLGENWNTYPVGTASSDSPFKGNQYSKIKQLAEFIGTKNTFSVDGEKDFFKRAHGGDLGIDGLSVIKLDDGPFNPMAMIQCTCNHDEWREKQNSILENEWKNKLESLAPYLAVMVIPFFYRDGKGTFWRETSIKTCLVDRFRLLKIIEHYGDINKTIEFDNLKPLVIKTIEVTSQECDVA